MELLERERFLGGEAGVGLRIVLGDLASFASVQRFSVPPLSEEAVAILAAGSDVDSRKLYRLTGGNAF